MMDRFYDKQGNKISMNEWGRLKYHNEEDPDYHKIGSDFITVPGEAEPIHVSTVWLGIDHAYTEGGPPVIFETMIFGGSPNIDQ